MPIELGDDSVNRIEFAYRDCYIVIRWRNVTVFAVSNVSFRKSRECLIPICVMTSD